MKIQLDKAGGPEGLAHLLALTQADTDVQAILILSCDANNFGPEEIDPILKEINKPVFGGIFPGIIHQMEKLEKGTIVVGLTKPAEVYLIPDLSDNTVDYEEILDEKITDSSGAKTMFVFVDGLAQRISALIDSLFNVFGLEINYIGGGAGSLNFVQKPVLFTNEGLKKDAGIIALTDIESGIGVSHGWLDVQGPLKVTDSEKNVIKSLDWEPAFKVYKEIVEKHSGKKFSDENFFEIAKAYPFGISKLGAEKVVRDPVSLGENDSMLCVGEVPNDIFLHILNGNVQSLVNAAKNALSFSKENYKGDERNKTVFFIDCISRALFLENNFNVELDAVFDKSAPLIGALTLGEIANNGKTYLEFYNKTAVIGMLE